jgi:cysteine desulfuration protein SufE
MGKRMNIEHNVVEISEIFNSCHNWEDKYRQIIKFGKDLVPMADEFKTDNFKVKGCQSQVWLHPTIEHGKVIFSADSDSMLVKGIISLLLKVYSGQSPAAIIAFKPTFLSDLGISEHLSMNRSNGLSSMIKQIQMYAFTMKALADLK